MTENEISRGVVDAAIEVRRTLEPCCERTVRDALSDFASWRLCVESKFEGRVLLTAAKLKELVVIPQLARLALT